MPFTILFLSSPNIFVRYRFSRSNWIITPSTRYIIISLIFTRIYVCRWVIRTTRT
nr:MAG TPA: hypothetical protein [Caudoviricetes sp.]